MTPRLLLLVPTSTYRARAFVAAARRLPVELSIASEVPSALSDIHPVSLPSFDFSDPRSVAAFIEDFAAGHPIDAVVPVDDQATMAAAMIAERLGLRGNPASAVHAARNKHRTRIALAHHGVASPRFHLASVDDDPRELGSIVARATGFPVVVKPLMMAASRGVIRADDPDDLADVFARVAAIARSHGTDADDDARSSVLVEAYVPGREVAVEGLVSGGDLDVMAVFDKPDPLVGPYFPETIYTTPSRLADGDLCAVEAVARATVAALGLRDGPVHAELRGSDGDWRLIEIAARSIGGLCSKVLRFDGGRSLEDVIVAHALGFIDRAPPLQDGAAGVMMMQAPARGRFERVDGADAARAVPGIDEVIISAHPGREITPLPEGFLYLGFIFARARTADAVEAALREAFARMTIVMT